VDDDLDLPVIEPGFTQINRHGAQARVDLGETAHLPSAREANLAHRGGDLERLLTPLRRRREFDGRRQVSKHRGDVGVGSGAQQPIEGRLKPVQIHLPLATSPCNASIPHCRRSSEIGGSVSTGSLSSLMPAHYRPMRMLPQPPAPARSRGTRHSRDRSHSAGRSERPASTKAEAFGWTGSRPCVLLLSVSGWPKRKSGLGSPAATMGK
jgi:hypothetical protein